MANVKEIKSAIKRIEDYINDFSEVKHSECRNRRTAYKYYVMAKFATVGGLSEYELQPEIESILASYGIYPIDIVVLDCTSDSYIEMLIYVSDDSDLK